MFSPIKVLPGIVTMLLVCLYTQSYAAVINVNTTINNSQDDKCSLPEALYNANNNVGSSACESGEPLPVIDEIHFNISGAGPHQIIQSGSFAVLDPVIIDGETQPGSKCSPRTLRIELKKTAGASGQASDGVINVYPGGNHSIIRGLSVTRVAPPTLPFNGISLIGDDFGNAVQNVVIECNNIGVDGLGQELMPHNGNGIFMVNTESNRIGGLAPAQMNIISGNGQHGIILEAKSVNFNRYNEIIGNLIGTNLNGDPVWGNQSEGIRLYGNNNKGNLVQNNTIAGNRWGILLNQEDSCVENQLNTFISNKIFSNSELGIDIHPTGPNLNDYGDADGGCNQRLNFPELTSAWIFNNQLKIGLDLDVNAVTSGTQKFRIDVYTNPSGADPTGFGEGQKWLGFAVVETDAAPGPTSHTITIALPGGISSSQLQDISTTTTEYFSDSSLGGTSEFSEIITVNPWPIDFGDAPDPTNGSSPGNYNTRKVDFGASHLLDESTYLGLCADGDSGDAQNVPASLDDTTAGTTIGECAHAGDDEDGIHFQGLMVSGQTATINVIAKGSGFFNAWIDYNKDGDWLDQGENIFQALLLTDGVHVLTFNVPPNLPDSVTYARFRYFKENLGYGAYRPVLGPWTGEVEDYRVKIYHAKSAEGAESIKWAPTQPEGRK